MSNRSEFALICFVSGILLILFIPIPARFLDFLLIINFSWAFTILLLSLSMEKPLSFSTFPALLLMSTLFRLALNISATRLILGDGKAGQVILAIGHFVIRENYAMGLVVFIILIIVQFIVVTNGSQRIAEVAARFTLDSLPGKQMSIDADLNMGLISQETAKFRRAQLEKEANFYGAMDGASKFVKGDAIAGILIVLVDIFAGFFIGIIQNNLSLIESIHHYSLLTVGDGLVTQIPALIIATATGIIVTRAATDSHLGSEVQKQISAYPRSLIVVGVSLLFLLTIQGMPKVPVLSIILLFFVLAQLATKKNPEESSLPMTESIHEKIKVYPIEFYFNPQLLKELFPFELQILEQIQFLRERLALEHGFIIPEVKIRQDDQLTYPHYYLAVQGNKLTTQAIYLDRLFVLSNPQINQELIVPSSAIKVRHLSGLKSFWIHKEQEADFLKNKYRISSPIQFLINDLQNNLQERLADLLTRAEVEILLKQTGIESLSVDLIPSLLSLTQVQKILHNLLSEKISIRQLAIILETLIEHAKTISDLTPLTELVRQRLAISICQPLINSEGILSVLSLSPALEKKLTQGIQNNQLALEPTLMDYFIRSLAQEVEKMLKKRLRPILICSSLLRAQLRQLTKRLMPQLTILALSEIPLEVQVEAFALIN